jgi:hypothetical protein
VISEDIAAASDQLDATRVEMARLREENRASRDPDIERRLVELHLEAAAIPGDTRHAEAPSANSDRDPFPELTDEPPSIDRSALTAEVLRGAIAHHGCLVVRGLIAPDHVDRLRADTDEALAALERSLEQGIGASEPPWFVPLDPPGVKNLGFGRGIGAHTGTASAIDSPRTFFDLTESFYEAGLREVLTEYLGAEPRLSLDKCSVRRIPPDSLTGWHQDVYRFADEGVPALDVWVALSECGVDAPGLEIVPRRVHEAVAADPEGLFPWVIPAERVEALAGTTPLTSPTFHPGDAVIFDEWLLHRTGTLDGMTKSRYSTDVWFFPPGTYETEDMPVLAL